MPKHASLEHLPKAPHKLISTDEINEAPVIPINGTKYIVFRLKNPKKGNTIISGYAENIYNPETKKKDSIRLLKGVYTIWKSEQKDITDDYAKRNRRQLTFTNNGRMSICRIKESDETAVQFARAHIYNMDNEGSIRSERFSFYEHNPQRIAEDKRRQQLEIVKAMQMAFKISEETPDKMRKHALYLGIRLNDELGQLKSDEALAADYAIKAQQNPKRFVDTLDDPAVEISYNIRKALIDTKIDLHRQPNTAYWTNGGFICHIPPSKKAQDYLIEFALLPSEQSKEFIERLKSVVT